MAEANNSSILKDLRRQWDEADRKGEPVAPITKQIEEIVANGHQTNGASEVAPNAVTPTNGHVPREGLTRQIQIDESGRINTIPDPQRPEWMPPSFSPLPIADPRVDRSKRLPRRNSSRR